MSIIAIATAAVRAYRRRREFARTEQLIAALPNEIRKDIGWPGRSGERSSAFAPVGCCTAASYHDAL